MKIIAVIFIMFFMLDCGRDEGLQKLLDLSAADTSAICVVHDSTEAMHLEEAVDIAAADSNCAKEGTPSGRGVCRQFDGVWNIFLTGSRKVCNPVCIVDIAATKVRDIQQGCNSHAK